MPRRLSESLRALAEPIWRAQLEHPFVRGIGQGTVDLEQFKQMVDRLGNEASAEQRARMEEAFVTSSRYEYLFWEMALQQERWPV